MIGYLSTLGQTTLGMAVSPHPATDAWMKGDRYGTVEEVGPKFVGVRMTRSGKLLRFWPWDLTRPVTDVSRVTADRLEMGDLIADVQGKLHTVISVEADTATGWRVLTDTYPEGRCSDRAAEFRVVRWS